MLVRDDVSAGQERESGYLPYAQKWRAAQEARKVRAYFAAPEKW